MSTKYLDSTGLSYLWGKLKDYFARGNGSVFYGTCNSAASTTTKSVTCSAFTSADLVAGASIWVKFSYTNSVSVSNVKMSVNSTGGKNIKYINNGTLGNLPNAGDLKAGSTYLFVYDGTYWVAQYNYDTSGGGGGGTSDYDQLSNRPEINSNVLTGDKSSSDLGLADAVHSHSVSDVSGLLDMFYPVGSYYETSDTSFDPNNSWGGTWVLETEGQVHVSGSASGTYQVGGALQNQSDGGEASHTLTENEMPSHTHTQDAHRHSPSSSTYDAFMVYNYGTVKTGMSEVRVSQASSGTRYVPYVSSASFDASYTTLTANETATNQNTGGGQAHNNLQPYIVVNRWHRTA